MDYLLPVSEADKCKHCANWDYSQKNMLEYPVPDDYLDDQHEHSPEPPQHRAALQQNTIVPVKMTYDYLKKGCTFCYYNVFQRTRNKTKAYSYLSTLGVSTEYQKCVIEQAIANRAQHTNLSSLSTDVILKDLKYPSLWT